MKTWLRGIMIFLFGVLASAVLFLVTAPPRGHSVDLLPAPTPAPLVIQVSGAVNQPGVYRLPRDARVSDAIIIAGGLLPDANQTALNLAARLKDGEKVLVLSLNATPAPAVNSAQPASKSKPATDPMATLAAPININLAPLEMLEQLPGIGATRAQDIIDYRQAHDGFKSIDEIQEVSGIGPATFEKLKDLITVN